MAPTDPIHDGSNESEHPAGGEHSAQFHAANGASANGASANGAASNGAASNGALATIDNRLPAVPGLGWSHGPPAKPEILKAKPNPIELLHAVRRRWPLAIGLGTTAGVISALLLWYFLPVRYEAFALMKVSERPPSVLGKAQNVAEEFAVFKRTQVQLILSNLVLTGTLREADISRLKTIQEYSDDPIAFLKDQLVVDYPDDAEILRISMTGTRRDDLLKIVDRIVQVYKREVVERERDKRLEHESKLQGTLTAMNADLQKKADALRALEALHKTSGSESAKIKKDMAIDELNRMIDHRTFINTEIKANNMQIMLMAARKQNPEDSRPPDVVIEMELSKDPIVVNAQQQLMLAQEQLQALRAKNPKATASQGAKKLISLIQSLEERIDERKNQLRPNLVESLATAGSVSPNIPQNHMMNLSLPLLEKQRDYLAEQLKDADKAIADQLTHVETLETYSAQVMAAQEELRATKEITMNLRSELDRIKIEKLAPERITEVDKAALTNSAGDSLRKYIAVAFTGLLGFGLVVVGIAFLEFQARKVNTVEEVNDGLGIRVVGELPDVTGRVWRKMKGGQGPSVLKALMSERIDGARTALIHSNSASPPRVVMVTSAQPREGKTTTASQLAASLARSGRRTLLIDADIRNPTAHRVFEMPQDPGLCELLRGEVERDAVIHPTRTANLWLLPGGRCDLRSVQALSGVYLGTALAALSVQFDYIVIDSGPVLKVADPLLIGQHVDVAIVSVLRDVSRVPKVYEACDRLRSVGISVLGSVVGGVNDGAARQAVELLLAETPQPPKPEPTTA